MKNKAIRREPLRLRNDTNRYFEQKKETPSSSRSVNNAIVCVLVLIFVLFLKMSNSEFAVNTLAKLDSLISSQMDIADTADKVVSVFNNTIAKFSGREIVTSSENAFILSSPVIEGTVTNAFEDTVHPVFGTVVKANSISIKAKSEDYVYSSCDGVVSNIMDNANGTKRVIVSVDADTKVVYDGVAHMYVNKDDKITAKQIMGIMPLEQEPTLKLELWIKNEAKDPMEFMKTQ